jgi:AraC-like DNA-binding protein
MQPLIQILSMSDNSHFNAKTGNKILRTTGWHQHMEYELILFTKGSGELFMGDYKGNYKAGDIYFIGSNLPHAFKNNNHKPVSAIVLLFLENCLAYFFMNLPEFKNIKQLLELAARGLKVTGNSQNCIASFIKDMEKVTAINRFITLLQCLDRMSNVNEYSILSKNKAIDCNDRGRIGIDAVLEFTASSFSDRISLSKVAAIACMSIPSFSQYFKLRTSKTYINYLNDTRINYACQQLQETNKPVTDICYESGYNTFVHFHRQFLRIKKNTPLQYRKSYTNIKTNGTFKLLHPPPQKC